MNQCIRTDTCTHRENPLFHLTKSYWFYLNRTGIFFLKWKLTFIWSVRIYFFHRIWWKRWRSKCRNFIDHTTFSWFIREKKINLNFYPLQEINSNNHFLVCNKLSASIQSSGVYLTYFRLLFNCLNAHTFVAVCKRILCSSESKIPMEFRCLKQISYPLQLVFNCNFNRYTSWLMHLKSLEKYLFWFSPF